MNLISSEDFLSVPNFFFKLCGRPTNKAGGPVHPTYYSTSMLFYVLLLALSLGVALLSIMLYMNIVIPEQTDWLLCSVTVLCLGYCLTSVTKMIALIVHNKLVTRLINRLRDMHPKTMQAQRQCNVHDYFTNTDWNMKTYSRLSVFMILFFAGVFTFLQSYQHYVETGVWEFRGPYPDMLWYPFDEEHGIGFYVALVHQYPSALFAVFAICAADTLLYCIVMQISMHFQELKNRFKDLRLERGDSGLVIVKELVAEHVQIIR